MTDTTSKPALPDRLSVNPRSKHHVEAIFEHDEWHGVTATSDTIIVISGEIDREWASVKVDVDRISIAQ